MPFHLAVDYVPRGDQAAAIDQLYRGIQDGDQHQVLLGVTGSGKTFTMAKVIEQASAGRRSCWRITRPSPRSFIRNSRTFFPQNAVEYFVSYYDYYQPEAYIPSGDVYIEKEATINDELDKLRLSATTVAVRAPRLHHHRQRKLHLRPRVAGSLLRHAADARKGAEDRARERSSRSWSTFCTSATKRDFKRGTFRVRGDVIEVFPTYDDSAYRIELWGDEIESLSRSIR